MDSCTHAFFMLGLLMIKHQASATTPDIASQLIFIIVPALVSCLQLCHPLSVKMFREEAEPRSVACLPGSGSGAHFGTAPHQHSPLQA